jgi:hypothetical protein
VRIPEGRYVSLKPQSSEMFRRSGERGKEGWRVRVNKGIVENFSCYTISLNILEFTQYLISSILLLQH